MKLVIVYLIAFFIVGLPATIYSQPRPATPTPTTPTGTPTIGSFTIGDGTVIGDVKVGDKAKNLKVLVPWTMRKCPKDFAATYTLQEGVKLKKIDNDCWLWQTTNKTLKAKTAEQATAIKDLEVVRETQKKEIELEKERNAALTKQLNKEIEEKNKHKYKPNYGWLYIAIGAAVAAVGVAFGIGAWATKE